MVAWNPSWMMLGVLLSVSLVASGCLSICTQDGSCGGTHVGSEAADDGEGERGGNLSTINGVACRASTTTSTVLEWSLEGEMDAATSPAFLMPVNATRANFQLKQNDNGVSLGSWRATLERDGERPVATLEYTGSTGAVTAMMHARTQTQVTAPAAGEYVVNWTGPAFTQDLTFVVTATACP